MTEQDITAAVDTTDVEQDPQEDGRDEADIAADYIEELLDICDLDGDIDIESDGERTKLSVTASSDSNLRVLATPEAVAALQELTRLAAPRCDGGARRARGPGGVQRLQARRRQRRP